MDTTATVNAKVQHVTKKSSDELLRKFAEMGDDRIKKKKKKKKGEDGQGQCESPFYYGGATLVERRLLLPPAVARRMALLRRLGIGRTRLRVRDVGNKSLLGTIEKTWLRTIEGASRVFMERHYHCHKRLINDIIV